MARIKGDFGPRINVGSELYAERGVVQVRGPHNRASDKWTLELGHHSSLSLYWQTNRKRAGEKISALRDGLDFIGRQLGLYGCVTNADIAEKDSRTLLHVNPDALDELHVWADIRAVAQDGETLVLDQGGDLVVVPLEDAGLFLQWLAGLLGYEVRRRPAVKRAAKKEGE